MNALPTEPPVFFIDRNSGGRIFRDLLVEQGIKVVLHDDEFPQAAADEDWLISVGEKGWIVITGDNATTSSPLFLLRLAKSKTFVFILLGLDGVSASEKADCILKARKAILRLITERHPPAIWRIGKDQTAREFDFQKVLVDMRRRRKA